MIKGLKMKIAWSSRQLLQIKTQNYAIESHFYYVEVVM